MAMLHPGSQWPAGSNPIPSPAVAAKFEPPSIAINRFFTKYKSGRKPPDWKDGDPIPLMDEEHWVEWVKKGEQNGSTCVEAIKRLCGNPEKGQPPRIEWHVIGPAYEAWRRGEEAPVQGTPLFAWAGISRELAVELRKFNIHTIEDLAVFPDHKLSAVPIPGLRELRTRAKATVDARGISDVGAELATRDERIAAQERELRSMEARLAGLQATIQAMGANAGAAAERLMGSMPHPDDEFVQPGLGDVRIGSGVSCASGFQRRPPADHVEAALGEVEGIFVEDDDEQ